MTQDEIDEGKLEVERGKLKLAEETLLLERKKTEDTLQLERQKHELEKRKSRWYTNPVLIAILAAALGFLANTLVEHRTASDNFKLKAAEIVMNSNGIDATREKSVAMQKLFPDELKDDFGRALPHLPPEKPELVGEPAPKEALIKLLAEHPTQREQIIKDYSAVFTDKWIKCLQTPNPCQ